MLVWSITLFIYPHAILSPAQSYAKSTYLDTTRNSTGLKRNLIVNPSFVKLANPAEYLVEHCTRRGADAHLLWSPSGQSANPTQL